MHGYHSDFLKQMNKNNYKKYQMEALSTQIAQKRELKKSQIQRDLEMDTVMLKRNIDECK